MIIYLMLQKIFVVCDQDGYFIYLDLCYFWQVMMDGVEYCMKE